MSILAADKQTAFRISGFETPDFTYTFTNGPVFSDYIQFGNPFPPIPRPDETVVSFVVSNLAEGLRIEGVVMRPYVCCDIPNVFTHSTVIANLVPGTARPVISLPTVSSNGAIGLMIWNGQAGRTNIIEASTDLLQWVPINTNIFPRTTCPMC
jgi:hypothetical protein